MVNLTSCRGNLTCENNEMEPEDDGLLHRTPLGRGVIAVFAFQSLLIILANSLVFLLFAKTRYLRTKTNYCLVSLAASDFLAGLVSLPLVLACSTVSLPELCVSMDLCQRFLSISTILHLLVATLERYFKIMSPFKYTSMVTKHRVVLLLLSVWTFSCFASFIQLAWINIRGPPTEKIHQLDTAYAIFCLAALAFLPFLIIACIDGHIFSFIRKEQKLRYNLTQGKLLHNTETKQRKGRHDRKAAIIYAIMTMVFAFGWFPYFIITLLFDLGLITSAFPFAANIIMVVLKFSTALINPLLYTFFKNDFKNALRGLMRTRQQQLQRSEELTTTVVWQYTLNHWTNDPINTLIGAPIIYGGKSSSCRLG